LSYGYPRSESVRPNHTAQRTRSGVARPF
jgi:hypothetical protein